MTLQRHRARRLPSLPLAAVGVAGLALAWLVFVDRGHSQDIADVFTFQGRLAQPDGTPVPDGLRDVQLAFYPSAAGGTPLCEWTRPSTPFVDGRFRVDVGAPGGTGSCTAIRELMRTNSDLWVAVAVEAASGALELLAPRNRLAAAPRAHHVQFAERPGDGLAEALVPPGMILMFDSACPAGWERVSELDDRFPVGAATGGDLLGDAVSAAGGGSHGHGTSSDGSHTHGVAVGGGHTHGVSCCVPWGDELYTTHVPAWGGMAGGCCERPSGFPGGDHGHGMDASGGHSHSLNDRAWSHTHTLLPPYRDVVFCAKL